MFKPHGNRVMVKLDEVGDKTEGGLYVPQSASPADGPKRATVVAVSDGYISGPHALESSFEEGDRVLVDALGGANVRVDGSDYLIVRNEDVVGRFEENS